MASGTNGRSSIHHIISALRAYPLSGRVLRVGSWILVAASAVFLVAVAQRHWSEISSIAISPGQWMLLCALAAAYAGSLFLLAAAWHNILILVGAKPRTLGHSVKAYTTAQLAKYIPGNVFHFVGRHLIHRAAGMDDKRLATATLVETLLLLLAAVCTATVCVLAGSQGAMQTLAVYVGAGLAVFLPVLFWAVHRRSPFPVIPLIVAFAAALMFFAIMAGVIVAIAASLGAGPAWEIGGGGIAAWLAGFVTPGAPGGLGVREASMVLVGGGAVSAELLLVLALLFRLVTFGGDIVCAALGRTVLRG